MHNDEILYTLACLEAQATDAYEREAAEWLDIDNIFIEKCYELIGEWREINDVKN